MNDDRRGVLYPGRLPEFHRLAPEPSLAHAVRWFWIPEWSLEPGVESRQELLPFPACNLVVEPEGVTVTGPPTRRSERVLRGSGWAVGALLRPAAVPALLPDPSALRDSALPVPAPELLRDVSEAMGDTALSGGTGQLDGSGPMGDAAPSGDARRARAAGSLARFLRDRVPRPAPGSDGELANLLVDAIADPTVSRVDQLPGRLHASTRTLQRVAERFVGLSPHSMIRRRRLQEGAQRLREEPGLTIAALAVDLGYADHAHFTTDFKTVMGVTPSGYRRRAAG